MDEPTPTDLKFHPRLSTKKRRELAAELIERYQAACAEVDEGQYFDNSWRAAGDLEYEKGRIWYREPGYSYRHLGRIPQFETKVLELEAKLAEAKSRLELYGSMLRDEMTPVKVSERLFDGAAWLIAEAMGGEVVARDREYSYSGRDRNYIFPTPEVGERFETITKLLADWGELREKNGFMDGSNVLDRLAAGTMLQSHFQEMRDRAPQIGV